MSTDQNKSISIIVSNIFHYRMSSSINSLCDKQGLDYEWIIQDELSCDQVRNAVFNSKNIILENNHDNDLWRFARFKNCLYVDSSPFRSYAFLFDNEGWGNKSRICQNTYWRKPLTKMAKRSILKYIDDHFIKRTGPTTEGLDVYVPSKSKIDTKKTLDIFKKHNIYFDQILTDASFPEETQILAEEFASDIGAKYINYRSNGIRLSNCRKITSDHIESTVLAILQGIIPYTFAPTILSGSHATYEYMGDIGFYYENISISQDHADSVLYRLLLTLLNANATTEELATNPIIYEFLLSIEKENEESF